MSSVFARPSVAPGVFGTPLKAPCRTSTLRVRQASSRRRPNQRTWSVPSPIQEVETAPAIEQTRQNNVPACDEPEAERKWVKVLSRAVLYASVVFALRLALPAVATACEAATNGSPLLAPIKGLVDFILHLDDRLGAIIAEHGTLTYAILFIIVFCETGLVLTPFLPGDSLLFASGAFAGLKKLNILYLLGTFIVSAILGDAVNYAIGSWIGERAIESKIVSKKAITKTEKFYEKYGGKTIVLARFVPIVRTFAPFVAGISSMSYDKFAAYNVVGAIVWTLLFCGAGFFFGNLPFVEKNFSAVVLAIVVVSVLPVIYEVWSARKEDSEESGGGEEKTATV
ncbi:hypothetical protein BSKO_01557 [Bryopsis sp. KO-2023]|nr:hypothetical protein BSKO_01557 [Bryopsis sp. KO-2023]